MVGKLNGATVTLELPREAENTDFWVGSWITQMANVYWNLPPRKAALLIFQQEVLPPWLKLVGISNFRDIRPADTSPCVAEMVEATMRAATKRRKPPDESPETKGTN